jgi:hypothetical protein
VSIVPAVVAPRRTLLSKSAIFYSFARHYIAISCGGIKAGNFNFKTPPSANFDPLRWQLGLRPAAHRRHHLLLLCAFAREGEDGPRSEGTVEA